VLLNFVCTSEEHRHWIWRSSVEQQQIMNWPPFNDELRRTWTRGYDEADQFATFKCAVDPVPCIARDSLRGSGARRVGYLSPGTVVWACLQNSPIWPARVCGMTTAEHVALRRSAAKDETEPLMFVNDDDQDVPLYSSTHSCYGFSADRCWQNHMKERALETAKERRWNAKSITKKTWQQWEQACIEAFQMCAPEEPRRRKRRRRS
jgi:PWWP domain